MHQRTVRNFYCRNGWLLLAVIGLWSSIHPVLAANPQIGEPPPLLEAAGLLQAPPGTNLNAEAVRGRVVVLEFWATWCGPCVGAIPHMNELADKFKDKPVQFIAITAEDEATIKPFLTKRPIHAWVALDTDRAMNFAYGVKAIPHTVVLDKEGKIAAITYPLSLTEKHIDDLPAGKKIDLPRPGGGEETVASKNTKPALFEVSVRPSDYTNSSSGWGGGRLNARAYTVHDILPVAFDERAARILTNAPLPEGKYDFTIMQPRGGDERLSALLQAALKSAFGVTGRRETNEVEVLLLKVKTPNAPGLVVSPTPGGSFHFGPGDIGGMDVSMRGLAGALETFFKAPVIDETGLTNHYDLSLKWEQASADKPNPEGLKVALGEQLGLVLEPGRRPIGMVRVDVAKRPERAAKAVKSGK